MNKRIKSMKNTYSKKTMLSPIVRASAPLACLLIVGLLSACSSVKTHVNNGAVKARTFSFLDTGSRTAPSYAEDRKYTGFTPGAVDFIRRCRKSPRRPECAASSL